MCLELQNKKLLFWKRVRGGTLSTVFHTWRCRCEGVNRNSGCGHDWSHLIHNTKHSIYNCIIYMEYELMFLCMSLHVHLGGE